MAGRRWAPGDGPPSHSGYRRNTSITDSTYMREVQRRIDTDYRSRLRLKERERMQAERKREQRVTQQLARATGYAGRSYDRPWISGMPSNRKMDIVDTEAKEVQHSPTYPRAPITGRGSKLPSLSNIMGKRQRVPELSDVPEIKGFVNSGLDHGPSSQGQRLQLKGKKSPPSHQVPKASRQSSAGTAPEPPVQRSQTGSLCCGDSAEEEGSSRRRDDDSQDPGLGPAPAPAPATPAPPAGREAEGGPRDPGEPAEASRLRRQHTSHILRRLRRERLSSVADGAGRRGGGDDRLPFGLQNRPWADQERTPPGAEEDRRAGCSPRPASPHPDPACAPRLTTPTSSRGTQTFRSLDYDGYPPGSPSPPPAGHRSAPTRPHWAGPNSEGQLPRLLSLLVTTGAPHHPAAPAANGLARLQPLSAARLGSASPPWAGQLHGPLSMTILAVSDLRGPEARGWEDPASATTGSQAEKEARQSEKPRPDPETLRKLQESLLHEEEEEEGDFCRICLIPGGTPLNPLLEPCKCVGSLQFVHHDCLKRWLQAKIISGADLSAVTTCELCKQTLKLDFDNFDVHEFHRKRAASQVEEQMTSSSVYMAVLLHLYEQRFTELMRLLSGSSTSYQTLTLRKRTARICRPTVPSCRTACC
ncbi:collagen alpha-1(I) chain-like isoform X2 [Heptranchias perlo]|uniref:collagen alpha-1(I) chain-like isoform X2 n=1 Tax=Heptranchias perlo TaxID=212740 RepID=UPI003559A587